MQTRPNGTEVALPPKVTLRVKKGSRLLLATAGGGYGDPTHRDPAHRAADERDGLVRGGEPPAVTDEP